MHVMMEWERCIETYDTEADGSKKITKAALGTVVDPEPQYPETRRFAHLMLWSQLCEEMGGDDGFTERGTPQEIARIDLDDAAEELIASVGDNAPRVACDKAASVSGFLELLGRVGDALDYNHRGNLLACEVDGAPLWEADMEGWQ